MNKTLRGTIGTVAVSVSLLAAAAIPASGLSLTSKTFKVDTIMKNDLKVKTAPSPQLVMGGSSFDGPLLLAAQTQWNTVTGKTPFSTYNSNKSGTGRANAISGAYNIGFSDFPLNLAATPDVGAGSANPSDSVSNYVQVPVALGGVAVIYHFGSGVSGTLSGLLAKYPLTFSGLVLGQVMAGKITNWNSPAIAKVNPHLVVKGKDLLPNLPIVVESRTSGSGTTYVYTDYLNRVDHTDFPAATSNAFPHAAATFSNSGLLDSAVHTTTGAIGYVEFGYAVANNSTTAALVNASAKTVKLSGAGILAAATAGLVSITKHGGFKTTAINNFSINNQLGATVYPIAGFSFAIVKKVQTNQTNAISIVKFLDFLSHQGGGTSNATTFGQDLADSQGYAPLPVKLQAIARTLLLGVTHGGHTVLSATN